MIRRMGGGDILSIDEMNLSNQYDITHTISVYISNAKTESEVEA